MLSLHNSAIRFDHDNMLIDIDSGQALFHLKAQSYEEFNDWLLVLQSYSKSMALDDTATSKDDSNIWDSDLDGVQLRTENTLLSLTKDIIKFMDLIDTSKSRIDSKTPSRGIRKSVDLLRILVIFVIVDLLAIFNNISEFSAYLRIQTSLMQREWSQYSSFFKQYKEHVTGRQTQTDLAFVSLLYIILLLANRIPFRDLVLRIITIFEKNLGLSRS
jgi:hypothetical protein